MSTDSTRNPVLLVHGIDDTAAIFEPLAQSLQQRGWRTHALDLMPSCGAVGLDRLAEQIEAYVAQTFDPAAPLDIVGFSMGGVISRYYVQQLGGRDRVQRFITVASPHYGSWVAYGRNNPGCHQMRPGSDFLNRLNQDTTALEQVRFTSIWTPYDLMIMPASSSQMPVGQEVTLPILLHPWMIRDARAVAAIADLLQEPVHDQPQAQTQTLSPT